MSDAPADAKPKKKGGLVKKLLMFGVMPLVLVGGGVGAGLFAAGKVGSASAAHKEDPNRPKLMLKSEDGHGGGEGEGHGEGGEKSNISGGGGTPAEGPEPANPDPSMYQATYYSMEQPFTSNLADSDNFLQVGIGVSTYYDKRVISNIQAADMPVRSTVLQVLSEQTAESLNTPEGKDKLRRQLRDAINRTLKDNEGFGGINDVFFTSFIIQ
jgi:flagellar FliL protein